MINVEKATFEKVIAALVVSKEYEVDTEYAYDTFSNQAGETVGIVSYNTYKGDTYSLYEEAESMVRDALGIPAEAALEDKTYRI